MLKKKYAIFVFLCMGCASSDLIQKDSIFQKIQSQWNAKKSEVNLECDSCLSLPTYAQSACYSSVSQKRTFVEYVLEKQPKSVSYPVTVTASYCAVEERYWINKSGGDIGFELKTFGPYSLNE